MQKPVDISQYISMFPVPIQKQLKIMRDIIKKTAPDTEEYIGYGMPGFKMNKKPLVYFAGYPSHIGFYPAPVTMAEFSKDLSRYKTGKGSVQFPIEEPLPLKLIARMVKHRMKEIGTVRTNSKG